MSDVPSEVVREILVRLPAESLLRCKSVCKEWLRIIEEPSFVKANTKINQFWSHTLLFKSRSRPDPLYSLCLDSFNFMNAASQMIDITRIKNLIPNYDGPLYRDSGYVASCNGLILTSNRDYDTDISVILNPLTKEYHYLPKPNLNVAIYRYRYVGYGFGYDSDSDDYKAVRIYEPYQTLVYSLKSDSWRAVEEEKDSPSSAGIRRNGTFLNGSLYWPCDDAIIALHLGTERYSQLPLPPVISTSFRFALDAMDGCLICTLKDKDKETFDGWVMKEKSPWIKLFSLQDSIFRAPLQFRFLAYLKRKEQVVLRHLDGFLWFYIGNINSIKKCSVYGLYIASCQICPGSLVRLSDYRGSHIEFGQVTTKRKLPVLEKMKMKMICDDLSS